MHPLLGDLDIETGEPSGTIERAVSGGPPVAGFGEFATEPTEITPKSYCESCGGVDQHMPGCPALTPPPEERFADFTTPRVGRLRGAAAGLLRRLAKLLDG